MSLFFSLIVGTAIQAAQYAPVDVLPDHWAYPAVNEMFKEGLLKGYPPEKRNPLRLRMDIRRDPELAASMFRKLYLRGVSVGPGPDGEYGHRDPRSPYSQAVHTYSTAEVVLSIREGIAAGEIPSDGRRHLSRLVEDLDEIVFLISMFQKELRELGGDPDQVVRDLEVFRQQLTVRFRG